MRNRGGKEGGRWKEEESIELVGPFDAWHVEFANLKSLVSCESKAKRLSGM